MRGKHILLLALAGCSTTTTVNDYAATDAGAPGTGGETDAAPKGDTGAATPQAILDTMIGPGTGAPCSAAGNGLGVGAFGDAEKGTGAIPVKSGASQEGKAVTVSCRVTRGSNGGFDVKADVAVDSNGSISLTSGTDDIGQSTTAEITLTRADGAAWSSKTCTLDPGSNPLRGIALGRYWTTFRCAAAAPTGPAPDACDVTGELRIENCTQQ